MKVWCELHFRPPSDTTARSTEQAELELPQNLLQRLTLGQLVDDLVEVAGLR